MPSVYALGSNGSGQLGIGHREDVSVPKQVIFKSTSSETIKVNQFKAGGNHSLLLAAGSLFCSGDSTAGACGLSQEDTNQNFTQIRLFDQKDPLALPIIFCATSWEASFIVQQDDHGIANKVYSFGTGNKGELGQGELLFRSAKAQLIQDFPPTGLGVADLAASVSHVVAVLSNGDVYGWGNGRKGQLGQPAGTIYAPRKIEGINFKVVHAVCGREFTCLVGEPESGKILILGNDKSGVVTSAPEKVPGWKDVGASWGSVFVLQQDGRLLSWGRDDHGQLAPPRLPPLDQIAVGSEHVLGLSTDGKVLAWGWGEHGNCGPSTTNGDVKGRWNVIASVQYLPPGSKIFSIGAGCATSWICATE